MAGLTEVEAVERPIGASVFARVEVPRARTYRTGMKHVRSVVPEADWKALLSGKVARHYRSAGRVQYGPPAPSTLTAWLHAIEASPWVLPTFDWSAALVSAYAGLPEEPLPGLSVGAATLASAGIVTRLESAEQVVSWLQRAGPVVVEGGWCSSMFDVTRDTETIGEPDGSGFFAHAVALVGVRPGAWPDAVRLVNNLGPAWGALGRAWMPATALADMIADGGEAWAVLPSVPAAKKGGAK